MALNTWWDGDLSQRYWMEIATQDPVGESLQSPKDEDYWSYDLVSQVQPGDRVLHYKSGAVRAIVGWSEVIGPATTVPEYIWQPRGTHGRSLEGPRNTPGWLVPLGGLHPFAQPLTSAVLQTLRNQLVTAAAALEATHGKPTYFPFYVYGGTQIRAQQGYMVKFPVELFNVLPGLEAARCGAIEQPEEADVEEQFQPPRRKAPTGHTTRVQDPKLRAAIERRSLDVAKDYYLNELHGTGYEELGKPFDIKVTVAGVERHCEVKGSSMLIDTVELTINEVNHGKDCGAVDLIVVDGIEYTRDADGEVTAFGGTLRVWPDWTPEDEALRGMKYAYALPPTPW